MRGEPRGRVEDYTKPFLVMAFVNLFSAFFMLWAFFGLPIVLLLAAILHHLIGRISAPNAR